MTDFERFMLGWNANDIKLSATAVFDYCNTRLAPPAPPMPYETMQPISEFLDELTTSPVPIDNEVAFESVCRVIFRRIVQGTELPSNSDILN